MKDKFKNALEGQNEIGTFAGYSTGPKQNTSINIVKARKVLVIVLGMIIAIIVIAIVVG